MLKKFLTLILAFALSLIFISCTNKPVDSQNGDKIKVSVTFNAFKEFVTAVGRDKVEVSSIVPDGSEAHGFEPKAQDLVKLSTAQVLVCNGLGIDAWAEEAAASANNAKLILVDSSKDADLIVMEESSEENAEEEDGVVHGKYDPHLWLGLKGAQSQAINIKDALIQADPDNKDYYEKNCNDFVGQLDALYSEYSNKFQSLDRKSFVTGHAAFGYLCRDFGLTQNSVSDIYAEGEPSAQQLTQLVDYCKKNNVTTIFAEELASPAVSQTLADEVKAKVETIFTIEGSENGKTYIERMTDNLAKIYESLK